MRGKVSVFFVTFLLIIVMVSDFQKHLSNQEIQYANGRQTVTSMDDVDSIHQRFDLCPDEPDQVDYYGGDANYSVVEVDGAGCMHLRSSETGDFNYLDELWWYNHTSEFERTVWNWPGPSFWEGSMSGYLGGNESEGSEIISEFTLPYGTEGAQIEFSLFVEDFIMNTSEEVQLSLSLSHECLGTIAEKEIDSNFAYSWNWGMAEAIRINYQISNIPSRNCIPPPYVVEGATDNLGSPFELKLTTDPIQATNLGTFEYDLRVKITENDSPRVNVSFQNNNNNTLLSHQTGEIDACTSYDPDAGNTSESSLTFTWLLEDKVIVGEDACTLQIKHESSGIFEYKVVVTDHWGASALDSERVYVESLPPEGTIFAESFDSEEEFDFSKDWTYSFKKYSPDLRIEENSFPGKEDGIRYVVKVGIDYKFQVSQNGVITTFLSMDELSEFWQMNVQSESEFDVEVKFKPELVFNWNFCNYQGHNCNSGEIGMGLPSVEEVYPGQTYYSILDYGLYFWDDYRTIDFASNSTNELVMDLYADIDLFEINLWDVIQALLGVPDLKISAEYENDWGSIEASTGFEINVPLKYTLIAELSIENQLNFIHYTKLNSGEILNVGTSNISSSNGPDSSFNLISETSLESQEIILIPFAQSTSKLSVSGNLNVMFEVAFQAEYSWTAGFLSGGNSYERGIFSVGPYAIGPTGVESRGTWQLEQVNPAIVWSEPVETKSRDLDSANSDSSKVITWLGISSGLILTVCFISLIFRKKFLKNPDSNSLIEVTSDEEIYPVGPQNDSGYPNPNWEGVWSDDGFEWIEYPAGTNQWFWKDQQSNQWFPHEKQH
jgi:hypothetical protein